MQNRKSPSFMVGNFHVENLTETYYYKKTAKLLDKQALRSTIFVPLFTSLYDLSLAAWLSTWELHLDTWANVEFKTLVPIFNTTLRCKAHIGMGSCSVRFL